MKVHALWQQGEVIWMCSSGRLTTAALTGSISTPGKLSNLLDWLEPPNTTHLVTLQSASISWCPLISLPCSYSRYPLRYGKSPHQLISSINQLNQSAQSNSSISSAAFYVRANFETTLFATAREPRGAWGTGNVATFVAGRRETEDARQGAHLRAK